MVGKNAICGNQLRGYIFKYANLPDVYMFLNCNRVTAPKKMLQRIKIKRVKSVTLFGYSWAVTVLPKCNRLALELLTNGHMEGWKA